MRTRLHLKGWTKKEMDHAELIFKKAEKNKHPHMRTLESSLVWFVLVFGILATLSISILLIPVYVAAKSLWAYAITSIFGLLLGSLIVMLVKSLHWLEEHHHILMSLLIPAFALANFFIVVSRVNAFNATMKLGTYHEPFFIGSAYFLSFVIPYIIFLFWRRRR